MATKKIPSKSQLRARRIARGEFTKGSVGEAIAKIQSRKKKASAKRLAKFVPSLKKLSKQKTPLTTAQRGAVTRFEKVLRYADHLVPLTPKQAKLFKSQKLAPGVNAIQLRNTGANVKVKIVGNDLIVTTNGSVWLYWSLDRKIVKSGSKMIKAGEQAFNMQFPIEKIAALAEHAFKTMKVIEVRLWATTGAVGETFEDLGAFIDWVEEKWNAGRYMGQVESRRTDKIWSNPSDPEKWVNGIAILIDESKRKGNKSPQKRKRKRGKK